MPKYRLRIERTVVTYRDVDADDADDAIADTRDRYPSADKIEARPLYIVETPSQFQRHPGMLSLNSAS